jgi:hypothetical protein
MAPEGVVPANEPAVRLIVPLGALIVPLMVMVPLLLAFSVTFPLVEVIPVLPTVNGLLAAKMMLPKA